MKSDKINHKYKFNEKLSSDDHCVSGHVVFNEKGEAFVAHYVKQDIQFIKIDDHLHDWESQK